ncbi:MAG: OmpA family protein [Aquificota bacterium]|nr:OmpA family protein [Aquificota bacterium]
MSTESRVAESKLKVAMENELECYTGKRKVFVPPPEEEVKEEKPKKEPKFVEETLKITARIHFDFDKYNIRKEYIPILNEVVRTLKSNEFIKVRIEGFTDIVGTKEYNEKLALKRAESVKRYLVQKGVPEDKIEIVGFGKERFIAGNEDSIGRLTNRRVEFIVIKLQED